MTLYDILKMKFPTSNFITDILLRDDGNGPYIAFWSPSLGTQPTQDQINTWLNDSSNIQQYTQEQNKLSNASIYAQLQEIDSKSIRALRTNDTTLLNTLEAQAVILRTKLLPTG